MSSPTNCLDFLPIPSIFRPLSPRLAAKLAAPRVRLAHFAFHPTVEDRLPKFPTVAELERRNFAFRDVTVQGIRGDAQILRRLSYIHHFARFIHEERHPGAPNDATTPPRLLCFAPHWRCG